MAEAKDFRFCTHVGCINNRSVLWSGSRDLLKFCEISDIISRTVQLYLVTMED